MSEQAMKFPVFDKMNNKLKFLHQKKIFSTPFLKRLLCNKLIQPNFDYYCSARYTDLTKKLKLLKTNACNSGYS